MDPFWLSSQEIWEKSYNSEFSKVQKGQFLFFDLWPWRLTFTTVGGIGRASLEVFVCQISGRYHYRLPRYDESKFLLKRPLAAKRFDLGTTFTHRTIDLDEDYVCVKFCCPRCLNDDGRQLWKKTSLPPIESKKDYRRSRNTNFSTVYFRA